MISLYFVFFASLCTTPHQIVFDDAGFRIELPADWNVRQPEVGPFAGVAELPPKQALAMIARIPSGKRSARAHIEEYIAGMKTGFEESKLLADKTITLENGMEAHMVHLQGANHGHTLRHLTYLVSGPGEHISITFATEEERFEDLLPIFSNVMRTLVFTGPPGYEKTWAFLKEIEAETPDQEKMKQLLANGADIDGLNEHGTTALFEALRKRDGQLVKWLLDEGLDPKDPRHNLGMTINVATPPIRTLIENHLGLVKKKSNPKGLEIQWVSKEAELFAGIMSARPEYVRGALEKDVDLEALEPNYQLPALPLVRQLIREYEALDLDATVHREIEQILVANQEASR